MTSFFHKLRQVFDPSPAPEPSVDDLLSRAARLDCLGRYSDVIEIYEQVCAWYIAHQQHDAYIQTLDHLASVYVRLTNYPYAQQIYETALTHSRTHDRDALTGMLLIRCGTLAHHQEKETIALSYFLDALPLIPQATEPTTYRCLLRTIATTYAIQDDYLNALPYFDSWRSFLVISDLDHDDMEALTLLSGIYCQFGEYEQARQVLDQAATLAKQAPYAEASTDHQRLHELRQTLVRARQGVHAASLSNTLPETLIWSTFSVRIVDSDLFFQLTITDIIKTWTASGWVCRVIYQLYNPYKAIITIPIDLFYDAQMSSRPQQAQEQQTYKLTSQAVMHVEQQHTFNHYGSDHHVDFPAQSYHTFEILFPPLAQDFTFVMMEFYMWPDDAGYGFYQIIFDLDFPPLTYRRCIRSLHSERL